jgi:SAM-dependent methyltransferase
MKPDKFSRLHELQRANDSKGLEMDAMRGRFDALRTRHEDGTAPQAVTAYQLFQTPAALASRLVSLLGLVPGDRVLEPSAGLARILDAIIPFQPAEVVAVEESPDCAGYLFRLDRAGLTIKQRDFLTLTPADLGTFDAIAMNPPFHMRADVRHIRHALTFLKPGGRLAAICMNTHHRETAFRALACHWEPLPASTFAEAGTQTETILLRIDAPAATGKDADQ